MPESTRSPSAETCDGIVCYAGVDWWYHNRGHSECQVMTRLARRLPVLWVNSIGMRTPVPGKTDIAWHRYARKLKSLTKGLRRDDESGMWVYSPLFVPRYTPRCVRFNGRFVAWQVARLCRRLKIEHPSVWVTVPTIAGAVERGRWVRCVFNRSDEFSAFPDADKNLIVPLERRLLELADTVIYVNEPLYERERSQCRHAVYLGHGVDFDRFAAARPLAGPRPAPPPAMTHLPRPIVGFYGAMDDYRMDLALLIKLARRIAPGTLVMIGPKQMDLSRLEAEPNVTCIGQLPPAELPAYAAQFDVGIIPFLDNDFNRQCNPIKLKEYLTLAFPVVATRLPAFEPYERLITLAESHEPFLDAVDRILKQDDDPQLQKRCRNAVAGDSWDTIADRAAELLHVPPSS